MDNLTMKGVTKSVFLPFMLMGIRIDQGTQKQVSGWKATGCINRTDFGKGSMPAMVVSEEVQLRASGELVKE